MKTMHDLTFTGISRTGDNDDKTKNHGINLAAYQAILKGRLAEKAGKEKIYSVGKHGQLGPPFIISPTWVSRYREPNIHVTTRIGRKQKPCQIGISKASQQNNYGLSVAGFLGETMVVWRGGHCLGSIRRSVLSEKRVLRSRGSVKRT
jgi:hypothetical protein